MEFKFYVQHSTANYFYNLLYFVSLMYTYIFFIKALLSDCSVNSKINDNHRDLCTAVAAVQTRKPLGTWKYTDMSENTMN